jgi:hypothetical protein
MLHLMPFTTLLSGSFENDGRILSGDCVFAGFEAANAPYQDRGWLPRVAGAGLAGLYISRQSYDGGTTT